MTTVRRTRTGDLVDPAAIAARLREDGHTLGKTRTVILDAVRAKQRAFTAEELAESLGETHVSTVYRTLALLEEIGVVRHIHLSHGPAIYERTAVSTDIRHLVCETCGRHIAVPRRVFDSARRTLERDYDFVLDGSHFAIVGRCRSCVDTNT
jgi:Fur family ferric uptake transcriptional regulator